MAASKLYSRRDSDGFYWWKGEPFRSVTTYLDYFSDGDGLLFWYGKMATLDCQLQLERYERGEITLEEAHANIRDTAQRMKAGERHKIYAGNRGTLFHLFADQFSKGLRCATVDDAANWLLAEAHKVRLLEDASDADYQNIAKDCANYVGLFQTWAEIWRPSWVVIGQEACVISEKYRFAGTMDSLADFPIEPIKSDPVKSATQTGRTLLAAWDYQQNLVQRINRGEFDGLEEDDPSYLSEEDRQEILLRNLAGVVRVMLDFKTSRYIWDTYAYQFEAYSRADFIVVMPETDDEEPQLFRIGTVDALTALHVRYDYDNPADCWAKVVGWPPGPERWRGFLGLADMVDSYTGQTLANRRIRREKKASAPKEPTTPKRLTVQDAPF